MTKPRIKRRVRNPVATRAKLLQATSELIARGGAERLSMKDAARLANVSRAAAYQHFEDRDHLLREAKSWLADRLVQSMSDSGTASLDESVSEVAHLVLDNLPASKVLVAEALAGKKLNARNPLYKRLLQILEDFKRSGKARRDIDVEIMAFIMLGSIATLIMLSGLRQRDGSDALSQRFTAEWTRVLRRGIFRAVPEPEPSPLRRRRRP